jgi:putative polyketide hydroxylase
MDRGASEDVPVLVIGGSLAGLSAALFLRWHGVGVLAVERHAGTAINARAGHFHLRTVEILRSAGLEDAVRRTSEEQYPPDGGINNVESLAGREIANYFPNLNAGVGEFSPTVRLFVNQDALEPILRARAAELGARLRYGAECTSLAQDADGVTAVLRDLPTGAESSVRARYVVAADGNRSPVRERLGIGMRGHGLLSHSITIYFRALADLGPLLKDRNQGVHYVTNPLMRGFFRLDRSGNAGFLVVNLVGDTARPEVIAAFPSAPWANVAEGITEQRALELLRAAIGVPGIPVVIENIATWRAEANCADRFRDGRVFLAGDAAHVVPPNGGYGGNTAVQDAHNLAWKLALTLAGVAGPGLLDTYDAERRPVGQLTVEQAFTRYVTRVAPYLGTENTQPIVDDFSMEIGYRYDSPAVVLEPGSPPLHEHPRESAGRPRGARTARLPRAGRRAAVHARPVRPELRAAGRARGHGVARRGARRSGCAGRGPRRVRGGRTRAGRPGRRLPRGVRDLAVRGRAGAAGRFRGLAGRRRGRRTRTGTAAGAPGAAVPVRRHVVNSGSGRRKKVLSWQTCTARTPSGRCCARRT